MTLDWAKVAEFVREFPEGQVVAEWIETKVLV